ncbi:MAG TPA: hypothetical protein VGD49_02050, partial [Longimicrobiales bacterium]
ADVYDALTTDRSYRSAFAKEDALAIMEREAGKMLDPHLLGVFKSLVTDGTMTKSNPQTLRYAGAEENSK